MKYIQQHIPEVLLIEPQVHGDDRGYFVETFRQDLLEQAIGYKLNFVQDNESKSAQGVLRGLHFQCPPFAQSKLVRVIDGKVLDVVVDIRTGSPTFGQQVSVQLSCENRQQLFIPRGFAHGFVVLSDTATFVYKVDNYYSAECEGGLAFDDDALNIDWQIERSHLQLSDKDSRQPGIAELGAIFDYSVDYYAD